MKTTENRFIEALREVLGTDVYEALVRSRTPLPRITEYAAEKCFVYKLTGKNVSIIRYQLQWLTEMGMFDFKEPKEQGEQVETPRSQDGWAGGID